MNQHSLTPFKEKYRDEISSFLAQFWKLVSGPLSLFLIPLFLSPEDQGFWYTFASLSALAIFADLGFTIIIIQFSAHEFAFLKIEDGILTGNRGHLVRLSSLFKFIIRWSSIMVLIVFPIIALVGFLLFKGDSTYWILPWIIYMLSSIGAFICSVLNSYFQGLEQVAKIQRIILITGIVTTLTMTSLLILGTGLYALAISFLFGVLTNLILLYKNYSRLFIQLLNLEGYYVNWRKELLPLLGKYSIAWSSSYFSFQVYTPLVFHFKGPIEAGKIGITVSLINAIYSISRVWLVAKTPKMNILVAGRDWTELDKLFNKTILLSLLTYILGMIVLLSFYLIFAGKWHFFDSLRFRFVGSVSLTFLSFGWFLQLFVSAIATYLRAHKQEVLMYIFLFSGIFVACTTYFTVKYLPLDLIFLGFVTSYLIFGFFEFRIYKQSKLTWHKY